MRLGIYILILFLPGVTGAQVLHKALDDTELQKAILEKTKEYEYLVFADFASYWSEDLQLKGFGKRDTVYEKVTLRFEKGLEVHSKSTVQSVLKDKITEDSTITKLNRIPIKEIKKWKQDSIKRDPEADKKGWPTVSDSPHWTYVLIEPRKKKIYKYDCYSPKSAQGNGQTKGRGKFIKEANYLRTLLGESPFVIRYIRSNEKYFFDKYQQSVDASSDFYEDENYFVKQSCRGEWGGAVWFLDKKSEREYTCESTCPQALFKIDQSYILISSLAHMDGSIEIARIQDPSAMKEFILPDSLKNRRSSISYYGRQRSYQSRSKEGKEILFKDYGMQCLASFVWDGEIYLLISDHQKTYLYQWTKNKLIRLEPILNKALLSFNRKQINTPEKDLVVVIDQNDFKGFIRIEDNRIEIVQIE